MHYSESHAERAANTAFASANRALSHCGIGAKVYDPK